MSGKFLIIAGKPVTEMSDGQEAMREARILATDNPDDTYMVIHIAEKDPEPLVYYTALHVDALSDYEGGDS